MTLGGSDRPAQNVYVVAAPENWPERPDPFVIYHQTYTPADGLYFWHVGNQQYERLIEVNEAVNAFAYAAYGALGLTAPVAGSDLGFSYVNITQYDSISVTPRGFTLSAAQGTWAFDREGVYAISLTFAMRHNTFTNPRVKELQVFNTTDGIAFGTNSVISTPGDSELTNYAITLLMDPDAAAVGKEFVFRLGGTTDSYTNVVWESLTLALWNVGEFRGTI